MQRASAADVFCGGCFSSGTSFQFGGSIVSIEMPVHKLIEEVSTDPEKARIIAKNPDQELANRGLTAHQIEVIKSLEPKRIGELLRQEAGPDAAGFSPTITVTAVIKF
jgi:hypothetical protein